MGDKDTRPVAVLGLGRFGSRLATQISRGGEEVLACDRDRNAVEAIAADVAQAVILDVTDEASMRSRGVHKVKAAVIAIGEDFEASVLATVILKQMKVPRIIARARSRTTAEVLKRVGADDVVLAEDEAADRWAGRILGPRVLNQIEFHEGYSIVEFVVPEAWVGKGLADLDVRRKYALHIVAVKRADAEAPGGVRVAVLPPGEPLEARDVLIVMGQDKDLAKLGEV
ncbi:MAG: TrkA family potassium uptake protein [Phycisphaerales bacterium]|nr:TrkA family potassium uptake protein [Phycisphaerales bacterium]MCB9840807.1 TrkA family potassium uptake protein [Phycisphaeraceae bacterium]